MKNFFLKIWCKNRDELIQEKIAQSDFLIHKEKYKKVLEQIRNENVNEDLNLSRILRSFDSRNESPISNQIIEVLKDCSNESEVMEELQKIETVANKLSLLKRASAQRYADNLPNIQTEINTLFEIENIHKTKALVDEARAEAAKTLDGPEFELIELMMQKVLFRTDYMTTYTLLLMSRENETAVRLILENKIIAVIGFKLFISWFYQFGREGQIQCFLSKLNTNMYEQCTPLYTKALKWTWEKKLPLISGLGITFMLVYSKAYLGSTITLDSVKVITGYPGFDFTDYKSLDTFNSLLNIGKGTAYSVGKISGELTHSFYEGIASPYRENIKILLEWLKELISIKPSTEEVKAIIKSK